MTVEYTTPVTHSRVLGLISGTSMDGIDVAGADLRLEGDTVELVPLGHTEVAYPPRLRTRLSTALPPGECDAEELCKLDTEVGQAFAAATRDGLEALAGGRADVVASMGQTLYHWVEGDRARGTLQLGQPAWIAETTGLPVVAELRTRDVAAGGHGAPLAGVLDALWLAPETDTVTIALNIGGIANITVVGGERSLAYDTGPGNALIDVAAVMATGGRSTQDTGGEIAARGSVHGDLLEALLADPYFDAPPPKSTGKEHFNGDHLRRVLDEVGEVENSDLLATVTELTAVTVAEECRRHHPRKVVASGGGIGNPVLMAALQRRLSEHGTELTLSDELGLPTAGKEAYLAALLGFLTWNGLAGNVPDTTGARGPRILGSITPGRTALRLPEPAARAVRRLRVTDHDADARGDQEAPCASPTS